jgi:phosphonate transport system substrate-binding protein
MDLKSFRVFIKKRLLIFSFFLLPFLLFSSVYGQETLILGIHPYLPSAEIVDRFTPLADYLSKKTGKKVVIEVSKDYKDHIEKIGLDRYDIAFMGPLSYVKMVLKYGNKPILCRLEVNGKPTFRGVIVTQKRSDIKGLKDLKGKRFAFVEPESTMGYIVPLNMLLNAGISLKDFSEYKFLYNHHNVALSVLAGDFDAGALKEDVFYEYERRGLTALSWSPHISEHLFIVRKKLPKETVDALRKSLLSLGKESEGLKILKKIQENLTGFVSATDKDYENLKNIYNRLKRAGYSL